MDAALLARREVNLEHTHLQRFSSGLIHLSGSHESNNDSTDMEHSGNRHSNLSQLCNNSNNAGARTLALSSSSSKSHNNNGDNNHRPRMAPTIRS